jgi:type IV fimbrial biogenesis protein FimT
VLIQAIPVRQQGMSLIEVMVAITLAAILLALGAPSFYTGMQNRQIRTAADAIQNGLQMARTEALRRNRNVKFALRDGNSWTVGCDPVDTTVVDGQESCPAVLQTREAAEGSTKVTVAPVQLLQSNLSVAGTPVFTGDLSFSGLGRTVATTLPAGNIAEYQITNPGGGTCAALGGEMRCLSIRITAGGQIRMCDPAVTVAGDPRAC